MAEGRPQVNQKQYLGKEATYGLATSAKTAFPSLKLDIESAFRNQFLRPMGKLAPMSGVRHREWATGNFSGGLDFNELTYVLAGLFGAPTPTTLSGSATEWLFTPSNSSFGTPQSYAERLGDAVASRVTPGVLFNGLDVNVTQEEATVSGPILARNTNESAGAIGATTDEVQQLTITGSPTGGTFTLTYSGQTTSAIAYNASASDVQAALIALSNIGPDEVQCYGGVLPENAVNIHFAGSLGATNVGAITTTDSLTGGSTPATAISTLQAGAAAFVEISQQPMSISECNVYLDSSYGSIGTTQYADAIEAYFTIPEVRVADFRLDRAYPSLLSGVVQAQEGIKARVALNKSATVAALRSTLNAKVKPTYFLRYEFIGATITGAYTYKFLADFAVQFDTGIDREDLNGAVYGHEYEFQVVGSTSMGGPMRFTLWNTVTGL